MSCYLPPYWPDYLALEAAGEIPEGRSNKGAAWLQAHPEDPYWKAHELYSHSEYTRTFKDCWEEAWRLS